MARRVPAQRDDDAWRAQLERRRARSPLQADLERFVIPLMQQALRSTSTCYECLVRLVGTTVDPGEYYSWSPWEGFEYHWDTNKARRLIEEYGIKPHMVSTDTAWEMLAGHDITTRHINHLPPDVLERPAILAWCQPNVVNRKYALIDGNHRVSRWLRDDTAVRVYILEHDLSLAARATDDEMEARKQRFERFLIERLG